MICSHTIIFQESLQNNFIKSIATISVEAENILKQLLSSSDSLRKDSTKRESNINEFESLEILKTLFQISKYQEIDSKLFVSYIEWGST